MRAAVVDELHQPLVIADVPDPTCAPDGAILKVEANGICRTDWALWAGRFWAGGPSPAAPFVLGHEFAGTIVEVGRDVRQWTPGGRATFPMNPGDGSCEPCRAGQQQVCENAATLVPGVSYQGAFAEYVAVRYADVNLVALPDYLSSTAAASLGCRYIAAFHGVVDQARTRGGEWVVVHGAGGGTGLAAVQIAAAIGANVIGVDVCAAKLHAAHAQGAMHTLDARAGEPVEAILDLTGGGAHVSLDCVGVADTCQASVRSLRTRGRHVQLGHTTPDEQGHVGLPIDVMMVKELEFLSAFGMAAHRFPAMLAMIAAGRLDPAQLVTRTVGLDRAGEVLESMESFGTTGFVVIDEFQKVG